MADMNDTLATNDATGNGTRKTGIRHAGKVTRGIGIFALGGALIALVTGLLALVLARYSIVGKLGGFRTFMMTMWPFVALTVIALVGIVIGLVRKTGVGWRNPLALLVSIVMLGIMYGQVIAPARANPPMHDITTDLDQPPAFAALTLPEDNLRGFENMQEWRAMHRAEYGDIRPEVIDKPPRAVLGDARALMEERGWDIVATDPDAGRIEAIAFAGFIRFRDYVVVEVTPVADGSTRVDMRSTSEVGVSDLGYNAARVREFLLALRSVD